LYNHVVSTIIFTRFPFTPKGFYMEKWIMPVNAGLALLIILAMAMITSDVISRRLAKTFASSASPRGAVSPTPVQSKNSDLFTFSPILEQALFGPATKGKLTAISLATQQQSAPSADLGDLILLGSAVGSFRETFALIQKSSSKEERVFRLGDRVFDAGELVAVRKEFAEIIAGGKRVKILSPSYPAAGPSAQPGPSVQPGGLATQVSSGSYVIDQRALNGALDNIGQAMTDARLLPSMKDGKVEGFRASEVRSSGLFAMIGIKNGDVLLRINDFPIDSPEKAIQSLSSLKGQNRIKLDLVRDGQPSTFNYDIR
jgi:general secretion pathway protein C